MANRRDQLGLDRLCRTLWHGVAVGECRRDPAGVTVNREIFYREGEQWILAARSGDAVEKRLSRVNGGRRLSSFMAADGSKGTNRVSRRRRIGRRGTSSISPSRVLSP